MQENIRKIPDFYRAARAIFRHTLTPKQMRKGMFAALAASPLLASSAIAQPDKNQTQPSAFELVGYKEDIPPSNPEDKVLKEQAKYLKDKAELNAAMDDCAKELKTCDPAVKAFADMIDLARKIPDQLTQVEVIQTFVNAIPYDHAEANSGKTDLEHHTLKQALDLHLAVCDESGKLKEFAAEKLQLDARWVVLSIYTKNPIQWQGGHAFTAVRIGDKVWAMNLADDPIEANNYQGAKAQQVVIDNSRIDAAGMDLGFSGKSPDLYCVSGHFSHVYLVPIRSFNSTQATPYISYVPLSDLSNVPPEARNAPKESKVINIDMLKSYGLLQTMLDAISISYKKQAGEEAKRPPPFPSPQQQQPQLDPSKC